MNDLSLLLNFGHDDFPTIEIIKRDSELFFGDIAFTSDKDVSDFLTEWLQNNIMKIHPNKIYFSFMEGEKQIDYGSVEVFGRKYILHYITDGFPSIKDDKLPLNIPFFSESIIARFLTIFSFRDCIFDGIFLYQKCDICGGAVFLDYGYDSQICFNCDRWLEQPTDDYGVPIPDLGKPSNRKRTIEKELCLPLISLETHNSFDIAISNENKSFHYNIERTKISTFEISIEGRTQIISSISEFKDFFIHDLQPFFYMNQLQSEIIIRRIYKDIPLTSKNSISLKKGSNTDKVVKNIVLELLFVLDYYHLWIKPE